MKNSNNNTNHTNVTLNLIQSLFKFNKLGNGETCQGLLRRFVHKITNNNEISPHNDMVNKNRNGLINLSTYRLIDFKNVKNLFPYFPISFSLKNKKLRRFRIKSGMTFIKQPAFTLAEVLITLGIIGIVAAMTIPTLITNYQKKQTVTKLQKAISVLNQAYKLSYDDVGEPSIEESYDMGATQYFEKYWAPYIKTALICTTYQQCGYKSVFPWKYTDDSPWTMSLVAEKMRTTFYTPDGFLYVILTASGPAGEVVQSGLVMVDINGAEGPNRLGRDLFLLQRVQENGGGIQPYGIDLDNSDINKSCSSRKKAGGHYCAEKIRRAGWEIDKSYPW